MPAAYALEGICAIHAFKGICCDYAAREILRRYQQQPRIGIETPNEDMDPIHARLQAAKQDFEAWQAEQGAHR